MLCGRCAWMSAAHDPTLPLGAAICFCAWRLFDKRKKRNPDGPYMGNSPVWGALGTTLLGLIVGGVVRAHFKLFMAVYPTACELKASM